ncbi:collagen-binding domain-containing protein [Janthinobacterium psychrotolerans]|uniref:PEP-CTERM protein-sorting domain-containing protein/choice-of-anchor A domain-containing protein n=1 Tax=Janthinobacterium psychrotolerans TaxID=1747903 RepID=A0A1A7C6W5_9BURK|nr:collagen-binding domain-containing protein [Janthinobacterium psychrotolerans]OBV40058.1 PEP-CTERM protein-sorting domain-containing protein/choice-of-anchor A domain-containing protein [Janthinobacterium psychrotolerans]
MKTLSKVPALLILSTAMAAGAAQADVLDLTGLVGKANLYSLSNIIIGKDNSFAGGIAAARDISASSFRIGSGAYGNYSVIAGGNFSYSNASLAGGYYAGGITTIAGNTNVAATPPSAAPAMSFATTSSNVSATSSAIGALAATGKATPDQWAPRAVTLSSGAGGAKSVEVFNMKSSDFGMINNLQSTLDSSVTKTVIFNLTGNANWGNMGMYALNGYNVLFNFVDATSVNFSSIDVLGSVLAPNAVIGGSSGNIRGTVVAGDWNANLTLDNSKAFAATGVAGFAAAVSPVPEPGTWAMLLAGLGLVGFTARRRKNKAAA